jgi:hypothetical protein
VIRAKSFSAGLSAAAVFFAVLTSLAHSPEAFAAVPASSCTAATNIPPTLDWEPAANYQEIEVCIKAPRYSDSMYLHAFIDVPSPSQIYAAVQGQTKFNPIVVIPGSAIGKAQFYLWSSRDLAAHGYVVVTVDPQGLGSTSASTPECSGLRNSVNSQCAYGQNPAKDAYNFVDAGATALDFIAAPTSANSAKLPPSGTGQTLSAGPLNCGGTLTSCTIDSTNVLSLLGAYADVNNMGVAGHSLGARAVSYLQGTLDPNNNNTVGPKTVPIAPNTCDTTSNTVTRNTNTGTCSVVVTCPHDNAGSSVNPNETCIPASYVGIKAAVAWDNDSTVLEGDCGAATQGDDPVVLDGNGDVAQVTFKVPMLGEADDNSKSAPASGIACNTSIKSAADYVSNAYLSWMAANQASMEVVVNNAKHLDWAQSGQITSNADSEKLYVFEYYTRQWFDLYLKPKYADKDAACKNLLTDTIYAPSPVTASVPSNLMVETELSTTNNSKAYILNPSDYDPVTRTFNVAGSTALLGASTQLQQSPLTNSANCSYISPGA